MYITLLTDGVMWSAPCIKHGPNASLYVRIPAQVSQRCGYFPGQRVEVRAVSKGKGDGMPEGIPEDVELSESLR